MRIDEMLRLPLPPVTCRKPATAIDASVDLARRLGVHVQVTINDAELVVGPSTMRGEAHAAWAKAKEAAG